MAHSPASIATRARAIHRRCISLRVALQELEHDVAADAAPIGAPSAPWHPAHHLELQRLGAALETVRELGRIYEGIARQVERLHGLAPQDGPRGVIYERPPRRPPAPLDAALRALEQLRRERDGR